MSATRDRIKPVTFVFSDDGLVPNNPLPLLVYRQAIEIDNAHPEKTVEDVFGAHDWSEMWRDGIFDYQHYHATVHEALGVARGHALVLFGGECGEAIEIGAGDVAILPAGTGHKCLAASHDLSVVGAYPPGPKMQVSRPTPENYRRARLVIPTVKLPTTDPVFGDDGPLLRLWQQR